MLIEMNFFTLFFLTDDNTMQRPRVYTQSLSLILQQYSDKLY